ncbi:MAG: methyltransferase domain-containing protein [Candidatus Omnitrophica bacterium]|nr:methyltransferase domain-containing protein [Candidatus Omnitrophota bacterium]
MTESNIVCPQCSGPLDLRRERIACDACGQAFSRDSESGLPLLFFDHSRSPEDVTARIKDFYEKTPFPDYELIDSAATLRIKSERGLFARLLDEQIPHGARILEAGCGTGQLSNFLGLTLDRQVTGADLCLNSLRMAEAFRRKNDIQNVRFLQMNLFKPVFKPGSFDLVICNGVLHHTSDPCGGFRSIARLVKPSGHVLVGLYHAYSRIPTDVRRIIFRVFGNRFKFLDYRLRGKSIGDRKKNAWFMDQYKNPHESKHTLGELIGWFKREGFEYLNGIPKPVPFQPFLPHENLFEKNPEGSFLDHFLVEAGQFFAGDREGGFFLMIGRKK